MPEEILVKPKAGQWLVSLDREKVYGKVYEVTKSGRVRMRYNVAKRREDGKDRWHLRRSSYVQLSTWTWEEALEAPGRYRFVDEVPEGFTVNGNGWKRPR
jgi:hypothetical protein